MEDSILIVFKKGQKLELGPVTLDCENKGKNVREIYTEFLKVLITGEAKNYVSLGKNCVLNINEIQYILFNNHEINVSEKSN